MYVKPRTSHALCHEFLHTRGKPVPRKKVSNNTYLERRGNDRIALVLHRTDIITYGPETISLNTGGWYTVTTKARINDGLPTGWTLGSTKGTWELWEGGWSNRLTVARFKDGITLLKRGDTWVVMEGTAWDYTEAERQDQHNASMRKRITAYVKAVAESKTEPALCTLCRPADTETLPSGRDRIITYGDRMGDVQHLVEHMLDGTLPDGLVSAAVTERGYLDHPNHSMDTIRRCLRSYLATRLYVGATAPQHGRRPMQVA